MSGALERMASFRNQLADALDRRRRERFQRTLEEQYAEEDVEGATSQRLSESLERNSDSDSDSDSDGSSDLDHKGCPHTSVAFGAAQSRAGGFAEAGDNNSDDDRAPRSGGFAEADDRNSEDGRPNPTAKDEAEKKSKKKRARGVPGQATGLLGAARGTARRATDAGKGSAAAARRRMGTLFERYRSQCVAFNRALLRFPQMIVGLVGLLRFVGVGTLGFLAIFLLHQLLLWASVNPADAFENAKSLYSIFEILWDTTANVLNAFVDVVNVLVPAWNMVVNHVIQPAVYVALDVFFLIFFQRTYDGLITEDNLAYKGFYCDSNDAQSKLMCGDFGYYYDALLTGEAGGTGVVDGSLVFSAETGRRMTEAIAEPLVPVLPMAEVVNAFNWLVTVVVVVGAQLADVAMHVVYTILSELAVLILDIIYTISNVIIEILLMLVRSGLLEKMMFLMIDLLTIYFVEICIPIIFFQIDAFLCAINLMFGQNTWDSQLECIEGKCFESDSEVLADLIVFTSAPVIWDWVYNVFHAAVYSKTGRSLFGDLQLPTGGGWIPENIPALQADGCASCFVCKVAEIRLVAFLVMTIVGCSSPGYYNQFAGGVEDNCRIGGSYYDQLCGYRYFSDLNLISDSEWRSSYPEHRNYDPEYVQNWASTAAQRAVELGGVGSPDGYTLDAIAQAWFQRDEYLPADEQSALFHRRMCQAMREARNVDGGPDYGVYEQGSLLRITSEFFYGSCKKSQHFMCYNIVGRAVQDFALEMGTCARDIPACLKKREVCLGTCGGEALQIRQDFATTVAKNELALEFLGEKDFARSEANCTMKTRMVLVPFFSGNPSFVEWSSRVRVRGGFTAIDPKQCRLYPQACTAIQQMLEVNPGLVYVDGEIRHRQYIRNKLLIEQPSKA